VFLVFQTKIISEKIWIYNDINVRDLQAEIKNINCTDFFNLSNNINEKSENFSNKISEIFGNHIPSKFINVRYNDQSWLNQELRNYE